MGHHAESSGRVGNRTSAVEPMQPPGLGSLEGTTAFRPLLVTKRQAARMLAVSVRTVEYLLAQKQLPLRKLGKRTLIPYSAVAQLARHRSCAALQAERRIEFEIALNIGVRFSCSINMPSPPMSQSDPHNFPVGLGTTTGRKPLE
ncbi:MAG: helix-turn-helix domain-containing protein [Terriglobales bacterium]